MSCAKSISGGAAYAAGTLRDLRHCCWHQDRAIVTTPPAFSPMQGIPLFLTQILLPCRCLQNQSKLRGHLWQTQGLLGPPWRLTAPWPRYQRTFCSLSAMPQQPALCPALCPACWAPICPQALGTQGQFRWLLQGVLEVPQGGSRIQAMMIYCRGCFQSLPNLVGSMFDHPRVACLHVHTRVQNSMVTETLLESAVLSHPHPFSLLAHSHGPHRFLDVSA